MKTDRTFVVVQDKSFLRVVTPQPTTLEQAQLMRYQIERSRPSLAGRLFIYEMHAFGVQLVQ